MRILIKDEFNEDVVVTKRRVSISANNTNSYLEFNMDGDRYYITIPNNEVELATKNLLQKGYLDARKYKTVSSEL